MLHVPDNTHTNTHRSRVSNLSNMSLDCGRKHAENMWPPSWKGSLDIEVDGTAGRFLLRFSQWQLSPERGRLDHVLWECARGAADVRGNELFLDCSPLTSGVQTSGLVQNSKYLILFTDKIKIISRFFTRSQDLCGLLDVTRDKSMIHWWLFCFTVEILTLNKIKGWGSISVFFTQVKVWAAIEVSIVRGFVLSEKASSTWIVLVLAVLSWFHSCSHNTFPYILI